MSAYYCEIELIAGNGGNGSASFRHEKFLPNGGPDGGDGGCGGSIIIKSNSNIKSLINIRNNEKIIADNGENGLKKNKHGKNAENIILEVPVGTVVFDEKNNILCDLSRNNFSFVAAAGGRGGRGNCHFKNSRIKAPKIAEKGELGEHKKLLLQLKIIADIGLLGMPNAGKSTLLSKITNAKPKIDDYPFTTLSPNIGVLTYDNKFLVADLPGIIKDAHKGKGLGHLFLQHLERCKIIIFLISMEDDDPIKTYNTIIDELKKYNKLFFKKKIIIVASKMDLPNTNNKKIFLEKKINKKIFPISSITNFGINELLKECIKILRHLKNKSVITKNYVVNNNDNAFRIKKIGKNEWQIICNDHIRKYLIQKYSSCKKIENFILILKKMGIIQYLKSSNAKPNDVVNFENIKFIFDNYS
ncbi:MAG: GTPase ObgE [Bacilli bacterium]|nr:GTPase ObgE [Bacilli bacterium]